MRVLVIGLVLGAFLVACSTDSKQKICYGDKTLDLLRQTVASEIVVSMYQTQLLSSVFMGLMGQSSEQREVAMDYVNKTLENMDEEKIKEEIQKMAKKIRIYDKHKAFKDKDERIYKCSIVMGVPVQSESEKGKEDIYKILVSYKVEYYEGEKDDIIKVEVEKYEELKN